LMAVFAQGYTGILSMLLYMVSVTGA
jgi:hypothetical protein